MPLPHTSEAVMLMPEQVRYRLSGVSQEQDLRTECSGAFQDGSFSLSAGDFPPDINIYFGNLFELEVNLSVAWASPYDGVPSSF